MIGERHSGWGDSHRGVEQASRKRKKVGRKRTWEDMAEWFFLGLLWTCGSEASVERERRPLPLLGLVLKHREHISNCFLLGCGPDYPAAGWLVPVLSHPTWTKPGSIFPSPFAVPVPCVWASLISTRVRCGESHQLTGGPVLSSQSHT